MTKQTAPEEQAFLDDLDKKLWNSADRLRSNLDAAVYKHAVLGLIFLKYVSDAFDLRREELEASFKNRKSEYSLDRADYKSDAAYAKAIHDELEDRDYFTEKNVFWVPPLARWKTIQENASLAPDTQIEIRNGKTETYTFRSVARLIDDALEAVEKENSRLKGIIEKNRYMQLQLEPSKLIGLISEVVSSIPCRHASLNAKDILGHVYEYFLGQFALAEGKKGGQYYTPKSIVSVIVEMLEPFQGKVYDPAMGSGGFFVQIENFSEAHAGRLGQIFVYGQKSNPTTWRFAAMKMPIRGIDFNFGTQPADTFLSDQHLDLRADFVMANRNSTSVVIRLHTRRITREIFAPTPSLMPIPASILERIEAFERNLESYLSPDYKEAQLRREFLDPLFEALGWDIANRAGNAEAYKDVVHEDTLRISGAGASAPDYSFRIGGTRKFFIEAKKPSVKIKDDPAPAAQLRRYSYSAKLPLGIVTDFEEFAIYDTRRRPRENDKASAGRLFYCTFDQFAEKWDEIAGIFSKEAILRGSFDKFAAGTKGKHGTSEFDDDFLADMETWRELLARNLALRNTLTQRDLNFAVQRILDRLIFLRIAEDRGIEPYGQLSALTAGPKLYPRFCEICERADFRYNSGLFHFTTEKGREEAPDKLTFRLAVDDAVLMEIISALYWPKSPYAFAVIPADILGHIYEQFLGKVIHLSSDHKAHVEEKPEVRKAGGVYYTPTYVVDYIVHQTVGPLLEGKTPKQVEKLKILDPACGSGSFLLGAFEFLLAWHLDYYLKNDPAAWAKKKNPPIYETAPNAFGVGQGSKNYLLTTAERKGILVANFFGVDIDAQAVEVTKLSLLLKVLEGEGREFRGKQLDFHRVLPDLGNNIKCGNSLIGSDFYAQSNLAEIDEEARYKINAFDWKEEFKPIMDAGGFDAVIGNPPYVLLQILEQPAVFAYTSGHFRSARYKIDTYHLFIERGLSLTNECGRFGYIVPNTFLRNKHAIDVRQLVLDKSEPQALRLFFYKVFRGASVDTAILLAKRSSKPNPASEVAIIRSENEHSLGQQFTQNVKLWRTHPTRDFEITGGKDSDLLLSEIEKRCIRLGDFCTAYFGIQTHDRTSFVSERYQLGYFPIVDGVHIGRYFLKSGSEFVDMSPGAVKSGGKRSVYEQRRIGVRQIGATPVATMLPAGLYTLNTVYNVFFVRESQFKIEAILGIMSSNLMRWYWTRRFFDQKKTFPKIKKAAILGIPVPKKFESGAHGNLVTYVERMLKLHADLAYAQSPDAQTRFRRDISATDRAIDQLVYQLYDLTPEEIALVEETPAPTSDLPTRGDTLAAQTFL